MQHTLHIIHENDSVAVALADLKAGGTATGIGPQGSLSVIVRQDIPFGHKVAIRPLRAGEPVLKYGEPIGLATQDIAIGDHVHTHNPESQRGRGVRQSSLAAG